MKEVAFWEWLFSLGTISWRFIQVVCISSFSLLLLSSITWCGHTTVCLTISLLKDIWTTFSFWLLWTKLLWTFVYSYFLCEYKFSFLWNTCPKVQVLGCVVIYVYFLKKLPNCFQSIYTILYSHDTVWVIHFLHTFASICYHCFISVILIDMYSKISL